jgi:hypothetical protein
LKKLNIFLVKVQSNDPNINILLTSGYQVGNKILVIGNF